MESKKEILGKTDQVNDNFNSTSISSLEDALIIINRNNMRITSLEKDLWKMKGPKSSWENDGNTPYVTPNKKRNLELKEAAYKFVTTFTLYGLARIFKTEHLLVKLMWTIMILGSSSFGLYILANNITDYLKYDVITNIERVKITDMTFPAVTICKLSSDGNPSMQDLISLQGSSFEGVALSSEKLDYFEIPDPIGNCLRYNGFTANNTELEKVEDPVQELVIEIASVAYNIGIFEVYIGDNYLNSFLDAVSVDIIPIANGSNNFHISTSQLDTETKLGEPYNQCIDYLDSTYRQANAIEYCINKELENELNCTLASYYQIDGLTTCDSTLVKLYYDACEQKSGVECATTTFKSILDRSDVLSSNTSVFFRFSISEFKTIQITQIPKMNEYSLLGSIGGALGLFIGIRLLSFIEVIEFLIEVCFIFKK